MQQTTNPLTEIGVILISVCLIAGGVLLLVLGKIDFTAGTLMFGLAVGLYGGNAALKSPSPAQQAQLAQISSQALAVLPTAVAAAAQPAVSSPPAAQATAPPAPTPVETMTTMPVPAVTAQQFSAPIQAVQS